MEKKDRRGLTIILAIVACILTIVNIRLYISKNEGQLTGNEVTNNVALTKKTDEEKKEELISDLKEMNERDRMERYFGEYIDYVESGEYEKAYNLLYPEFKENYFPSIEEYEEYVKEKYPEVIIVDYDNIERQGQYYVLFIKIQKAGRAEEIITQNVVVYEKDYAEYYIAFSL